MCFYFLFNMRVESDEAPSDATQNLSRLEKAVKSQ